MTFAGRVFSGLSVFLLVSCVPNHFESKIEHLGFAFCETLGPLENVSGCCHLAYWFCLALPASRLCVTCNGQWIRHHPLLSKPLCHMCALFKDWSFTPAEVCNSSVLKDLWFVPPKHAQLKGKSGCSPQLATLYGSPLSSPVLLPGILDFSWKF